MIFMILRMNYIFVIFLIMLVLNGLVESTLRLETTSTFKGFAKHVDDIKDSLLNTERFLILILFPINFLEYFVIV